MRGPAIPTIVVMLISDDDPPFPLKQAERSHMAFPALAAVRVVRRRLVEAGRGSMRAGQDLSTTAQDLALLRHLALDIVSRDEKKASVHTKRRLAG